jgi:glycosyltransferase involved in cell wall biosynthesis
VRILFAHNRYQNLGGEDLAAKVEMELVESHGHAVDLFEVDNAEIVGIVRSAKTALGTIYSRASKRKFAAKIQTFKPSVVHVFNFFPLLSPSIHYACWEAGVPVVQKVSNFRLICPSALFLREGRVCEDCVGKIVPWPGILHACYRDSWMGSTVVATMLATHRLLGTWEKVVDAYISRTNFSRDKLIEGGFPAEKIAVIPSFAPNPGDTRGDNGRFALFAGRLSPEKGIATLLSAWSRLDDSPILLKVAGDGPLRKEVARLADGRRLQYLGPLSRGEIHALLREAAFLVFPSVCYENFPLSIVDAFACGVPVLASRLGAMEEIIEDRRTGLLFRPGDAEDLASKVEWAWRHPEELARMRPQARAEYLARYTPAQNYKMLIELYSRVTGGKSPASSRVSRAM